MVIFHIPNYISYYNFYSSYCSYLLRIQCFSPLCFILTIICSYFVSFCIIYYFSGILNLFSALMSSKLYNLVFYNTMIFSLYISFFLFISVSFWSYFPFNSSSIFFPISTFAAFYLLHNFSPYNCASFIEFRCHYSFPCITYIFILFQFSFCSWIHFSFSHMIGVFITHLIRDNLQKNWDSKIYVRM